PVISVRLPPQPKRQSFVVHQNEGNSQPSSHPALSFHFPILSHSWMMVSPCSLGSLTPSQAQNERNERAWTFSSCSMHPSRSRRVGSGAIIIFPSLHDSYQHAEPTFPFTFAIGTYFEMKRFGTMEKQGAARCNVSPIPGSFARPFAFICCGEKFRRRSSGLVEAKNKDDSPPLQSRGRVAKKDS
ncbi:AGAP008188-PA, partial [Anopheles gambiae str. PEST]